MRIAASPGALVVELGAEQRCLSSAVLGGGLGRMRSWLDLGVPGDYARLDPEAHLLEASAGLAEPVIGMLTAVDVTRYRSARSGGARAVATVGAAHALAAAGRRPRAVPSVGTINVLVVVDAPLTDAGLAGALLTAVEAKAQALADARVPAPQRRRLGHGNGHRLDLRGLPAGGVGAVRRTGHAHGRDARPSRPRGGAGRRPGRA